MGRYSAHLGEPIRLMGMPGLQQLGKQEIGRRTLPDRSGSGSQQRGKRGGPGLKIVMQEPEPLGCGYGAKPELNVRTETCPSVPLNHTPQQAVGHRLVEHSP